MSTLVAHQFDDAEQQFEAAQLGMWLFLATEVLFFGGLFTGYAVYRWLYPAAFVEGSRHMSVTLGALNTAVLLVSSLTMAMAVYSAQTGGRRRTVVYLLATIALGLAFLGVKAFEYHAKFVEHLVPGNRFELAHPFNQDVDPRHVELLFSFYFAMTGMHALHMVVGVGLVAVICWLAWRGQFSREYFTAVELTGLYWHFVDVVWVFLFPLLYLIR